MDKKEIINVDSIVDVKVNKKKVMIIGNEHDSKNWIDILRNAKELTYFNTEGSNIGFENVLGYNTDGIMVFEKDVNRVTSTLARNKLQYTVKKCFKHSMNEYITEKGKVYKI